MKATFFYWEIVELVRRTILTGWVVLIPHERVFLRLIIGLMTSLSMLLWTLQVQPYLKTEDNILAISSQVLLSILFLGRCAQGSTGRRGVAKRVCELGAGGCGVG